MRLPLSWLKEYCSVNMSPAQIAKVLTMAGLEVDAIETKSLGFQKVVVGKVTGVEKHPDADKLCVATVSDGVESYQVVCGASNCRAGIKTAFAMVGAVLHDEEGKEFKIKRSKIRGIESFGMLCTGRELSLSDEHDGILEFADHLKEGADIAEMYADTVFEISLTPNLGHCNSIFGVARELSAATGVPLKYPEIVIKEEGAAASSQAQVTITNKQKCTRYACRVVNTVKVGPSPDWMQKRLLSCGIRPINTIVDVTNYVFMELGHPLHAFDFDTLKGHKIDVRSANEGEHFTTLDGKDRILKEEDLLICDGERPIAIAGVMGGQNTEVTDNTVNVLVESAHFLATSVRRSSKRLGLQTDASKRFERGCDPNNVIRALDRAAMLMHQLAGGKVSPGVIDVKESEFPEKVITCRFSRVNSLLGTHLGVSEVETIFKRLGMPVKWDGHDKLTVHVPTYRVDITAEVDLIEEVARLYGYDNIEKHTSRFHASRLAHTPIFLFERETRSRLMAEGLQEFLTCDLIGPTIENIVGSQLIPQDAIVRVLNPTSVEQSVLRTSLLPGLLQVVKYNWDHQCPNISGFEIGRVHFKKGDQYIEQSVAGIILSGKRHPHSWDGKAEEFDFFDLKGIVENMLAGLHVENVSFKPNTLEIFHSGRQGAVYVGSLEIGSIGEVHPSIQRRLDVPQRIYFAEFDLHNLLKVCKKERKMEEIPIFPCSERDWTITLPEAIPVQQVLDLITAVPSRLLEEVTLLDLYRSGKIGSDKKNVTFHFVYRDAKKTIEQEAVDAEHGRIITQCQERLKNL